MRCIGVAAAALTIFTAAAFAQNMPVQSGPQNPAVKSPDQNTSSAPVAGANSFTMGQAQSQLAAGYTHIENLKKDQNGVWRGVATKDGVAGPVSVDYQGNVN